MASRPLALPIAQIPNSLTLLRLLAIPVFIVLAADADHGKSVAAAVLFAVAAATDQLDGWLARRWHVESRFGAVADPLADRLMIDVAVIMLWWDGRVPIAGLVLVLGRDLLLVGGYKLAVHVGYELSVHWLGKAGTWILYLSLALMMVTSQSRSWPLWLFWIGLGLALAAAAVYVARALRTARLP
ncbi:MAG: CDP-alcohol phosphatidyltransferase family protein [Gaiellaceae bacterium]